MLRRALCAIAVILLLIAQSSCIVHSIHPWFPATDAVFEQDLLGGWIGTDEGKDVAMTFVRASGNSYFVQYQSGDTRGNFRGLLGKLSGEFYLDFSPVDEHPNLDGMLLFPMHAVAKLEISPEKLTVRPADYDVLQSRAKAGKISDAKLTMVDEGEHPVFVSRSDELRSFLVSHSRDSELWDKAIVLTRRK